MGKYPEIDAVMSPQLFQGDCLIEMVNIPDGSVDMVLTSPPYDNLRDYGKDFAGWGPHIWKPCLKHITRVLKDGGVCVWVVGDATIKGSETGTAFKQALFVIAECRMNLHDTMIWEKQSFTATGSLRVRYASVFEYMFVFSKGKVKTFNPIKDKVNVTAGNPIHGTIRQADGTTRKQSNQGKPIAKFGQRHNVWKINTEVSNTKRAHPAQFPEQLAQDHIISWSNPGDTILDPFMGSGTTGVACKLTGRKFIGIEQDKTYFEAGCKIIEETPKPLFT